MSRILIVAPSLSVGGAERSVVKTANLLAEGGHAVSLAVLDPSGTALEVELLEDVSVRYGWSKRAMDPRTIAFVTREISRFAPDVIVGWSTFANLLVSILARKSIQGKIVLCERLFLPQHFQALHAYPFRRWLVRKLLPMLYGRATLVTANSTENVKFIRRMLGGRVKTRLLPNVVDVESIERRAKCIDVESAWQNGEVRLTVVGRLEYQKGVDTLLHALSLLIRRLEFRLCVVGDGPDRASLEALAIRLGIGPSVKWIGKTDNPYPYLARADLAIVPSRYEGYPNVMIEAMCLGTPVIAADCPTGPRELSDNGRCARLVPVDDVEQLAQAILDLAADQGARRELSRRARMRVVSLHDVRSCRETYLEILT